MTPRIEKALLTLGKILIMIVALIVVAFYFKGCQPEPIATSQQTSLPVQDNFEQAKIWTDADFKSAEIDPLDVNYNLAGDYPPDHLTDETVRLIQDHTRKQLQRLTAGATQ